MSLDQGLHTLDLATDPLTGTMAKTSCRPDDVVGARRFFGRYMSARVHCGDQERNEDIIRVESTHRVGTASGSLSHVSSCLSLWVDEW